MRIRRATSANGGTVLMKHGTQSRTQKKQNVGEAERRRSRTQDTQNAEGAKRRGSKTRKIWCSPGEGERVRIWHATSANAGNVMVKHRAQKTQNAGYAERRRSRTQEKQNAGNLAFTLGHRLERASA